MSYLLQEKKKSGTYLSICENYRDSHGKVVRKVLFNLGKLEAYKPEALKRIAEKLYALAGGDIRELLRNHDINEISRMNYGFPLVCGNLMKRYQLDVLFNRIKRRYKLEYDLYSNVLLMICNRF